MRDAPAERRGEYGDGAAASEECGSGCAAAGEDGLKFVAGMACMGNGVFFSIGAMLRCWFVFGELRYTNVLKEDDDGPTG